MWPNLEIMSSQRYLGNYEASVSRRGSKHRPRHSEDLKTEADMMVCHRSPMDCQKLSLATGLLPYILQREHRPPDTSYPCKFPVFKPENKWLLVEVTGFVVPWNRSPVNLIHVTNSFTHFQITEKYHLIKYFLLLWFLEWNKKKLENLL